MAGIPLGLINGVSPPPGGIKAGNDYQDAAAVAVEPYNMHVSAKYLELTKRKLELTRLPHELEELPEDRKWNYGPPKTVLEPLVDYWLCDYSWRAEESHYNTALPQYRTTITIPSPSPTGASETLRIHFVHKRCCSSRTGADGDVTPQPQPRARRKAVRVVPLLFCHDVQVSSFLDVSGVLDALTSNSGGGGGGGGGGEDNDIVFDVVAPSVPGTGFSDASGAEGFGAGETADVFDALMKRLGYGRYVAFGAGWGFAVCRALALRHGPDSCVAIHTANPASFFPPPSLQKTPLEWMQYQWARVTGARVPGLSFGYAPADFDGGAQKSGIRSGKTKLTDEESAVQEVPTNDHLSNVADGMEAAVCLFSRPQTLAYALCDSPVGLLAHTLDLLKPCLALGRAGYLSTVWTPAILLSWTMLQWLPGPESGFRWMQRAKSEIKVGGLLWRRHSEVPLGISQFGKPHGVLRWAQAWQEVRWLKNREASDVIRPEWESPEELAQDLRESFGSVWSEA